MLGIVLVNYKSVFDTIAYCKNELSKISTPHRIVIVNNSSEAIIDETIAIALFAEVVNVGDAPKKTDNHIYLVSVKENLGYAQGNNLGVQFFNEHFSDITHFLFTNNDLIFVDDNCVEVLIEKISSQPEIGVIGPRIIDLKNNSQSPHRYQTIWDSIIFPWLFYPIWAVLFKRGWVLGEVVKEAPEGFYYRIMGCFYVVNKHTFNAVDGFDSNTFLYAEEAILSERFLRKGFKTYFCPSVTLIHNHGSTTRKHFQNEQIIKFSRDSLLYYYRNYRNVNVFLIWLGKVSFSFYFLLYNKIRRHKRA